MGLFAKFVTAGGNLLTEGLEKVTGKEFGRTTPEQFLATKTGRVLQTGATLTTLALGSATGLGVTRTIIGLIGLGILAESPKARGVVKEAVIGFDPGGVGIGIGKAAESGKLPDVGAALKGAGILGGITALGVGAVIGVPKILEKIPKKKPKSIAAEKPITPETQVIQTQPEVVPTAPTGNGKAINVNVNVSQRQTRRIKNIVVFQ